MRRILTGLTTVLLLVAVSDLWANPTLYSKRWQQQAGWTTIDSLGWRAGYPGVTSAVRAYDANIDTLTAAGNDTTPPYPIDGACQIGLAVWNKKFVIGGTVTYTVQVADDTLHWTSLGTTFTLGQTGSGATDSVAYRDLLSDVGNDSSLTGFNAARDRRKLATASYLRVIADLGHQGGTDTTIHCGTLKVRWPRDPKTR